MPYEIKLATIKRRRQELKLSQTEMTKLLGLATVDQYYRRENGQYNFQATELPKLADALQMPMESFFTPNVEKIASGR